MKVATSVLWISLGVVLISVTRTMVLCEGLHLNGDETTFLNSAIENLENSPYYEVQEGELSGQDEELQNRLNLQRLYQILQLSQSQNEIGGGWSAGAEKRAPSNGFFGVRGKKAPSNSFYGVRGKKAPSGSSFYGVRGKKMLALPSQYFYQSAQGPFYPIQNSLLNSHSGAPVAPALNSGEAMAENSRNKESADATSTNNGQEPRKRAPSDGFMGLRGKRQSTEVDGGKNSKNIPK